MPNQLFNTQQPKLLGLAYRILGSLVEAEDVVQETYLVWSNTNQINIEQPAAWLKKVCTRKCLDVLKSAHHKRVDYVGMWLPEPIHTQIDNQYDNLALASSLTTAFLLMLERLTPKERAAYLLRDIFDTPYSQIANTLELNESTCRKLVSRAKNNLNKNQTRYNVSTTQQEIFLDAFQYAIESGSTEKLSVLLSDEIKLSSDGGGKISAVRKTLRSRKAVETFITKQLHISWHTCDLQRTEINGLHGLAIRHQGNIVAILALAFQCQGYVSHIYIMRNPDKINRLDAIHIY